MIAARPEAATRPPSHVLTIVPVAAGDLASGYGGRDGQGFQLELKRPSVYAFRSRSSSPSSSSPTPSLNWSRTSAGWRKSMARFAENPDCYSTPSSMPWSSSRCAKQTTRAWPHSMSAFESNCWSSDCLRMRTRPVGCHWRPICLHWPKRHRLPFFRQWRRTWAIQSLFTESIVSNNPMGGGAWFYADLLWALELLAWSPRYMPRVAMILARLSHMALPDNWGNRPVNSLLGIFRSWNPQTTMALEQRITVLDKLIVSEPDIGFGLLGRLLHQGPEMASPAQTPKWRDDDAGTAGRPAWVEVQGMLVAAADRMISMANGNAGRLVRSVDKLTLLDSPRIDAVLAMIATFTAADSSDSGREPIRNQLGDWLRIQIGYAKRIDDRRHRSLRTPGRDRVLCAPRIADWSGQGLDARAPSGLSASCAR